MTAGSGSDQLFGQAGDDTLLGKGGFDLLFGGDGNDVLTGGDGDDQMFGEGGNDRMIWNPGDDTDLAEGGDGFDIAEVNGGGGAEVFTVTANGTRVRFDRITPAPFAIDIGTTEQLVLRVGGGDDIFSATGNLAALIDLLIDGGAGNDTILGGNGADVLLGGDGNDFIDGQQGNDLALLGPGDDVFQWDPGDGNDVLEGQDGTDAMLFNGSGGSETIDIFANGGRALLFRDLGAITMDLDDVERIEVQALGGAESVTVHSLAGTDVTQVTIDLAGTPAGSAGDAAPDRVAVEGTAGRDVVSVTLGGGIVVRGLAARVTVDHGETTDRLTIRGLDGNDRIDASALPGGTMALTLDGGAGIDTLIGGRRGDLLIGGAGRDILIGGLGSNDFDFNALSDSVAGADRDAIIGFQHKIDDIDVADIDADATAAGNQAFTWIGKAAFSGIAGQLRVNASGAVLGDVNGDGLADLSILVRDAVLSVGDFVL